MESRILSPYQQQAGLENPVLILINRLQAHKEENAPKKKNRLFFWRQPEVIMHPAVLDLIDQLIHTLEHPTSKSKIKKLISLLNHNLKTLQLDTGLTNKLGHFFSCYPLFNTYLSDELAASLMIHTVWESHLTPYVISLCKIMNDRDNSIGIRSDACQLLSKLKWLSPEVRTDAVHTLLSLIADHHLLKFDACKTLAMLRKFIPEESLADVIAGIYALLSEDKESDSGLHMDACLALYPFREHLNEEQKNVIIVKLLTIIGKEPKGDGLLQAKACHLMGKLAIPEQQIDASIRLLMTAFSDPEHSTGFKIAICKTLCKLKDSLPSEKLRYITQTLSALLTSNDINSFTLECYLTLCHLQLHEDLPEVMNRWLQQFSASAIEKINLKMLVAITTTLDKFKLCAHLSVQQQEFFILKSLELLCSQPSIGRKKSIRQLNRLKEVISPDFPKESGEKIITFLQTKLLISGEPVQDENLTSFVHLALYKLKTFANAPTTQILKDDVVHLLSKGSYLLCTYLVELKNDLSTEQWSEIIAHLFTALSPQKKDTKITNALHKLALFHDCIPQDRQRQIIDELVDILTEHKYSVEIKIICVRTLYALKSFTPDSIQSTIINYLLNYLPPETHEVQDVKLGLIKDMLSVYCYGTDLDLYLNNLSQLNGMSFSYSYQRVSSLSNHLSYSQRIGLLTKLIENDSAEAMLLFSEVHAKCLDEEKWECLKRPLQLNEETTLSLPIEIAQHIASFRP